MSALTRYRSTNARQARSGLEEQVLPKRWLFAVALATLFVGVAVGGLFARTQGSTTSKVAQPAMQAPAVKAMVSPGPSRFDGFTPVGYQRSEAGAVAAASAYTAMVTELIRRPEAEIRAAARLIATPEAANAVEESLVQPISSIRSTLALAAEQNPNGRALIRTVPLGSRLVSYSSESARVDVWAMGIVGIEVSSSGQAGVNPAPESLFTITSYTLTWDQGDWHVADYRYAEGVGPALSKTPTPQTTQLIDFAAQYAPFRYLGSTEVTR